MIRTVFLPIALGFALVLGGCGFTPMHQAATQNVGKNNVIIDVEKRQKLADNRAGFFLTQRLRDRMGTAAADAPYKLSLKPSYRRTRLGLTDGDVATRYDVTINVNWILTDTKTDTILDRGTTSTISTFGAPSGPYGVITADNVGVEQAAKQTADKLVIELAHHFAKAKYDT